MRNDAEISDAYAKKIAAHYTGKGMAVDKDSNLNLMLRQYELAGDGNKMGKCRRLASHCIHEGVNLEAVLCSTSGLIVNLSLLLFFFNPFINPQWG